MTAASTTRRAFVSALAAGAVLAPAAAAEPQGSDVEILEELLVLEARLAGAYEAALRRDAIDRRLGELLRDQERAHIRALDRVLDELGGRSPRATAPMPDLAAALGGRDRFARFALDLEERATAAYADAAARIRSGLRRPLGSIMACEAGHQVALRSAAGLQLLPRGVA
jgi:rubrerythrin